MASQPERRTLTFQNHADILAEAQRLAAGEVRVSGKHSFGQILNHLALSQDVSTGRTSAPPPPFLMKLMMPLMKRMVINDKPLKPGFKLSKKGEGFFWPDEEFDVPAALQHLEESSAYFQSHGPLKVHPFFGKLTREQAGELDCRHAALHLSFVHPA